MTLSEEERKRIEEEERVRAEARFRAEAQARQKAEEEQRAKAGALTRKIGIGCLGLLVLIIVLIAIGALLPESKENKDVEAQVMCEHFVKDRLKVPRSADFPWVAAKDVVRSLGNGRYIMSSYVDAENSFGAKIRARFACTVEFLGKNNWSLESLTFQE
jgi:hypothetical protein